MDFDNPSSRELYATCRKLVRYLASCKAKRVFPFAEFPQINHVPQSSGVPMDAFHAPVKFSSTGFYLRMSLTDKARLTAIQTLFN